MESFDRKDVLNDSDSLLRQDIYSKVIRAGRRTYFFDVKSTKNDEYFLTITESKRMIEGDGSFHYEKHKIFLYREDFEKFMEALNETMDFIGQQQPEKIHAETETKVTEVNKAPENIEFEDLNN